MRAVYSTRIGGVSSEPWLSFNLGNHVGDNEADVAENRRRFVADAFMPSAPQWLTQVHGTRILAVDSLSSDVPEADGAITTKQSTPLVIMTADCLPILLCNRQGTWISAVHAGWRGLADGIVENAVAGYRGNACDLMAWLGPCIGPYAFEVGAEVRKKFVSQREASAACFTASKTQPNKFYANLPLLATQRLQSLGIVDIADSGLCTYSQESVFFSHRRDGNTGRMAAAIWMTN
ncbi:peptidoglycan editing factor PgeF [Corallincola platygyrae]|uniref:Purine nucleoside phosphorylase n=1 Tax=Corallincola platygyrae TaxID=1193278 RepID=A0ABW4XQJ4_9GAMM